MDDAGYRQQYSLGGRTDRVQQLSHISLLDGSLNTFIGLNAGAKNFRGTENAYVGAESATVSDASSRNVTVGAKAGYSMVRSSDNVVIGRRAGYSLADCHGAVIIGTDAGANVQRSRFNTMIGYKTGGQMISGTRNTFVGAQAGFYTLNASDNVFVGDSAGMNNRYGRRNTMVGTGAGKSAARADDCIFIGFEAGATASNISGSVAIGSNVAASANSVTSSVVIGDGAAANVENVGNSVAVGAGAGSGAGNVESSVFVGAQAGQDSQGGYNTYVGREAGADASGNLNAALGYGSAKGMIGDRNAVMLGGPDFHGTESVVLGHDAGSASFATSSVLIGSYAGRSLTGADGAVLVGGSVAGGATRTEGGTMVGYLAGSSSDGTYNTFVGRDAGSGVSGGNNVCVGASAGLYLMGDTNLAIMGGVGFHGNVSVVVGPGAGFQAAGENSVFVGSAGFGATAISSVLIGDAGCGRSSRGNTNAFILGGHGYVGDRSVCIGDAGYMSNGDWNTLINGPQYFSGNSCTAIGGGYFSRGDKLVMLGEDVGAWVGTGQTCDESVLIGFRCAYLPINADGTNDYGGLAVVAIGPHAAENWKGNLCTILGGSAGYKCDADGLTLVGFDSGAWLGNGSNFSTAVGYRASRLTGVENDDGQRWGGEHLTTVGAYTAERYFGNGVTIVGAFSGGKIIGDYITIVGEGSGTDVQSGHFNTVLGAGSGMTLTGDRNVILGGNSVHSAEMVNTIVIGSGALVEDDVILTDCITIGGGTVMDGGIYTSGIYIGSGSAISPADSDSMVVTVGRAASRTLVSNASQLTVFGDVKASAGTTGNIVTSNTSYWTSNVIAASNIGPLDGVLVNSTGWTHVGGPNDELGNAWVGTQTALCAIDASSAWVGTSTGYIVYTPFGGSQWPSEQYSNIASNIGRIVADVSTGNVWAVSNNQVVLRSAIDARSEWTSVGPASPIATTGAGALGVAPVAPGFAGNVTSAWAAWQSKATGNSVFVGTANGGVSWVNQTAPLDAGEYITDFSAVSDSVVWACTSKARILRAPVVPAAQWTVSNTAAYASGGARLNRIAAIDSMSAVAVGSAPGGSGGLVLRTTDGGANFTDVTPPVLAAAPVSSVSWDGTVWWAGGSAGVLASLSNSSAWTTSTASTLTSIVDVSTPDLQNVWSISGGDRYNRSNDGGATISKHTRLYDYDESYFGLPDIGFDIYPLGAGTTNFRDAVYLGTNGYLTFGTPSGDIYPSSDISTLFVRGMDLVCTDAYYRSNASTFTARYEGWTWQTETRVIFEVTFSNVNTIAVAQGIAELENGTTVGLYDGSTGNWLTRGVPTSPGTCRLLREIIVPGLEIPPPAGNVTASGYLVSNTLAGNANRLVKLQSDGTLVASTKYESDVGGGGGEGGGSVCNCWDAAGDTHVQDVSAYGAGVLRVAVKDDTIPGYASLLVSFVSGPSGFFEAFVLTSHKSSSAVQADVIGTSTNIVVTTTATSQASFAWVGSPRPIFDAASAEHTIPLMSTDVAGAVAVTIWDGSTKAGSTLISFVRSGGGTDAFAAMTQKNDALTTLAVSTLGYDIVITTDPDCQVTWTFL